MIWAGVCLSGSSAFEGMRYLTLLPQTPPLIPLSSLPRRGVLGLAQPWYHRSSFVESDGVARSSNPPPIFPPFQNKKRPALPEPVAHDKYPRTFRSTQSIPVLEANGKKKWGMRPVRSPKFALSTRAWSSKPDMCALCGAGGGVLLCRGAAGIRTLCCQDVPLFFRYCGFHLRILTYKSFFVSTTRTPHHHH